MIAYRDSSFDRPTLAQARAARAAGVRAWGGYIATAPGVGLAAPWSRQDFANVQQAGLAALAFCSGGDDAAALRRLAAQWGVRLMLDVESGIRGDGSWVDPFLAVSGAGLYGLCAVHYHAAPAHVVARYPGGDPGATWDSLCPRPAGLLGWQSQGTHTDPITGLSVDSGWLDDGFGVEMFTADEKQALVHRWYMTYLGRYPESQAAMDNWANQLADDRSNVREVQDAFATTPEAQAWLAVLGNVRTSNGLPSAADVALRAYLKGGPS